MNQSHLLILISDRRLILNNTTSKLVPQKTRSRSLYAQNNFHLYMSWKKSKGR